MVERFLSQTSFVSQEDYRKNLHIRVPENFNFGYDVVDAYAAEQPGKEALLWTNDQGAEIRFTFADIKRPRDGGKGLDGVVNKAAGYFNPFLEPMMKGGAGK